MESQRHRNQDKRTMNEQEFIRLSDAAHQCGLSYQAALAAVLRGDLDGCRGADGRSWWVSHAGIAAFNEARLSRSSQAARRVGTAENP
jgi:hypothetical protein